ncbi:homoserine kinase [Litorihabitans aurantiacus]|uniref:Homoserine kinase n=1 Tax=Litorihabitans aurantiacus TaxID=1930061 RepID=A0AA37UWR0_9MICO|nr:homoserine kinase [Litorihabitans aurantiacus]GMA30682.1 homoserine kinase [Litorihabitans aurantiacus]
MRIANDSVRVRVPATSANLGPGFDVLGIALGLHDVVEVRATAGATRTAVRGEGAQTVPDGEDHLVVRAVRAGLEHAGAPQVGLDLSAYNRIPHGRGLGSSAAAVVAGLVAARGLISEPEALADDVVLELATAWEGHPDNAAAAIYGGATLAWAPGAAAGETARTVRAERLDVDAALTCTAFIPATELATKVARGVLPDVVPHADAAFTGSRTALLVLALAGRTDLMMTATEDRLHQPYRRDVLSDSSELVDALRAAGHPAVISGAGPTVLVLGTVPERLESAVVARGWRAVRLPVDHAGAAAV